MCQVCRKENENVSVQLKESALQVIRALIVKNRECPLSIEQLFRHCFKLNLYRLICESCAMELAEELLLRQLEEVHLWPKEREMIMSPKRILVTWETDLLTDLQMTELINAMSKADGKLEYKEIPKFEIYGDSAFKGNTSQQGVALVLRETQTENGNLISWRSNGSERKLWSSLAAETHVSQIAIDKAIHIQNLCLEWDYIITRTVVLSDNLSLRRVVYNGRPTKEMRLRREVTGIRDMIVSGGIQLRFPSVEMLADPLTKSVDGSKLLKLGVENQISIIEHHDNGHTSEKDLIDANQVIEMELLSERLEKIKQEYEARRLVKGGQRAHTQSDPRQLRKRRKRATAASTEVTNATNNGTREL